MIHVDSYLFLSRHGIYYFRALVPFGIRDDLYRKEYRRSMQTRTLHVARSMARVLRFCFESQLEGVRTYVVTWEDLKKLLDSELRRLISAEQSKLMRSGPYPATAELIWKNDTIPNYEQAIQKMSEVRISSLTGANADDLPEFAQNLAGNILKSNSINLDRSSDLFSLFCEVTVRMCLEFTQKRIVMNGDAATFQVDQGQPIPTYVPTAAVPVVKGTPISEVVEVFCKEMVAGGNWTEKTEAEYRTAYKLLVRITNDMPMALVDHPTAQFFKATMQKLPSNMNKKPLYREKTIKELAAMKIPKEDLLSIRKVNSYMGRISQFFGWAERNGYAERNPFASIGIKQKENAIEDGQPFSNDELGTLFSSSVFKDGDYLYPYFYWLPLLGLYTGARLDELCQLYLDDIYQIEDLWVIDFNTELNKKLKNVPSKRILPIHSRLIDSGLLEFVSWMRKNGHVRLFPELRKRRDGHGETASKWFGRYRKKCGVTGQGKNFHSFRHTFEDSMKNRPEPEQEPIMKAMMGHKDSSVTTGLYGGKYKPSTLAPAMERIHFPVEVRKFEIRERFSKKKPVPSKNS